MKHALLVFALSFFALFATLHAQQTLDLTIQHNGLTRQYRLYVPAIYNNNTPVPLLFNLHGYGSNNFQQLVYGDFRSIADTANFLICAPNGTPEPGTGSLRWNSGFATGVDDVGFLSALIDTLSAQYNINLARVYSAGMSNGGFMSFELACMLSDRIAAVASVTGSMTTLQFSTCTPNRAMPVMQIHGTADATVPYNGAAGFASMEQLLNYWINHNGCNPTPTITPIPDINTTDGSTAERYDYGNCTEQSAVVFYKVTGGGHTWPGSVITLANTNKDFSASKVIWEFFRQYTNPNYPDVTVSTGANDTASPLQIYPNPATDAFQIIGLTDPTAQVYLVDITGKPVQSYSFTELASLNASALPAGLYFVVVTGKQGAATLKLLKN